MQLKLQSILPQRSFSLAQAPGAEVDITWQQRLITISAVSLAVLTVASIAVLMSLLD